MSKISKKDKRRFLFWSLLILIIVSYLGVFTYNYWSKILANYQEREILEKDYENLLSTEKKLSSEATKLLDPEYVAKFAREKYMYTKDGEKIIRIPE
ncbi:MAG: septum formation initiator family protein [Bacilli bacterium]|nr:septum formation initiator family protein [Bacilli bacterium]